MRALAVTVAAAMLGCGGPGPADVGPDAGASAHGAPVLTFGAVEAGRWMACSPLGACCQTGCGYTVAARVRNSGTATGTYRVEIRCSISEWGTSEALVLGPATLDAGSHHDWSEPFEVSSWCSSMVASLQAASTGSGPAFGTIATVTISPR